jgi:hypothetical protein
MQQLLCQDNTYQLRIYPGGERLVVRRVRFGKKM